MNRSLLIILVGALLIVFGVSMSANFGGAIVCFVGFSLLFVGIENLDREEQI